MSRPSIDPATAREHARAKADEARAILAAGVEHVTHDPDALARFLAFRAHFRAYSLRNALLIQQQRPGAVACMGFRAWLDHGRAVRKGERGLMIFAPIVRRRPEEDATDAPGPERAVAAYRVAHVWDIDQTDVLPGHEETALSYASPVPRLAGDDFAGLRDDLAAVAAALGYAVEDYAPRARAADGFCDYRARRIGVKHGPANQQAETLAHELAHALAHGAAAGCALGHDAREIQAEGAAYLACYALGLDASAAALFYLKGYARGRTPEERTAALVAHLAEIDRIGWRLVELVEQARAGTLRATAA